MAAEQDQSSNLKTQEMHDSEQINGNEPAAPVPKQHHTTTVSQVPVPPFGKLANPGLLGLIGFALTTFVLGLYQCGAG